MKISIIIPIYNEAKTLPELLRQVQAAEVPAGCGKEIVVVNDGSTDRTNMLLEAHGGNSTVITVHLESNRGKGAAIRAGLAVANGDIVLIQDGDLEYDPKDYKSVLTPLVADTADVVYGSRFLGTCEGMKWQNRLANSILTATANLLYRVNITDQGTAYKAFRAELLRSFELQSERFEFCSEVTAKTQMLGYQIYEVPITYKARTLLQGKKIRPRDGFQALWTLLKFRFWRPGIPPHALQPAQTRQVSPHG